MPLFEINDETSTEAAALFGLRSLVAASGGFRRLNLDRTAEQSLEKVRVCQEIDPWLIDDAGNPNPKFSIKQLEELLVMGWVQPAEDDGYEAAEDPEALVSCPREGGTFELTICRQITAEEYATHGPDDLYLWFLDCVGRLAHDVQQAANAAGSVLRRVRRPKRPGWNHPDSVSAQGRNLYASFEVDWGDRGGDE